MLLCFWCFSNKTVRSDDGDEDGINDSAAGPSKSKAKATPSPAVQVQSPNELFNAYADAEEPDMMGAEGLESLCAEGDIPMDGARPLLLAWELDAKELGVFTREEWTKGLDTLQVKNLQSLAIVLVDLENLLILRKTPPARPATQSISKNIKSKSSLPIFDKYNKDRYWGYAANVEAAYLKFYNFCFALVKKSGSRNIDMEYASAFWSVILAPIYPMMTEIIEFINEKGTYKGVNKDLWSMMREFCRTVKPSLEGYDSDGAWPTLLDDFVEWKKTPKSATETEGASGAFA